MEIIPTFDDKNRYYRTYPTICGDEGDDNNYSKILFHKVKWSISERPDITELQDIWAEEIMQYIINGHELGGFQVMLSYENDKEKYGWLDWKLMTAWDGMS